MEVTKKNIQELDTQVNILNKKIDRILMYLESDDKTKTKGLVEKVSDINERVAVLEDDKNKLQAKVTILSSVIGFVIVLGKELYTKVFPE